MAESLRRMTGFLCRMIEYLCRVFECLRRMTECLLFDRIFMTNHKYFIMNIAKMLTVRTTSSR
jgi:hypothetical protein